MTAWTVRLDSSGPEGAVRVAVKDAIDMAGLVTTAGCVAVRDAARPAPVDADCLAGIRAAEAAGSAVIVGRTTLTELCLSPTGLNSAFGTPVNPLAPDRIPGGSSSGSAVAVAVGEADIALGTDTGGSVRIPAACCGIVGLKTTWGRIPLTGVWPLAVSLDTVGPLARDVAGVVAGMRLLEPDFSAAAEPARLIGRLRIDGVDPAIEAAIDAALAAAGLTVHSVSLPGWAAAIEAFNAIVLGEFWQAHHELLDRPGMGRWVSNGLRAGAAIGPDQLAEARLGQSGWRAEVAAVFGEVALLALPTLPTEPPQLTRARRSRVTALTAAFNLSGSPALALPVPGPELPASLQLVGPLGREDQLCATGLVIEAALTAR